MAKHRGKKYLEVAKLVETGKLYDIREALELVQKTKTAKFIETVVKYQASGDVRLNTEEEYR